MAVTSENVGKKGRRTKKVFTDPTPDGASTQIESADDPGIEIVQQVTVKESEGKVLMKMDRQNHAWTTSKDTTFTQEHPYQLVDEDEADELLAIDGFRISSPDELVRYYEKATS